MCEPVTIAGMAFSGTQVAFASSLAVTALSGVTNFIGQSASANAQAEHQQQLAAQREREYQENARRANEALGEQYAAENERISQTREVATEERLRIQRDRLAAQGTAIASSEAAGLSFGRLIDSFAGEEARYRDTIERQLSFDLAESERRMFGYEATAEDRINSIRPFTPSPVERPSLASLGLGIAASGFDSYMRFSSVDPVSGERRLGGRSPERPANDLQGIY